MVVKPLTLDSTDGAVMAARDAEHKLFNHYGINTKDHYILLPGQGVRVRVSEFGAGPPLVVIPGNTGDAFVLASLLAQIKGRRIFAVNRPGGGLSEGIDHTTVNIRKFAIETLEVVLRSLNLINTDVVAHSMGAHWGLWLAIARPQFVRSLTLLGNPGNVMKGKPPLMLRIISKPPFNKLLFWVLGSSDKSKALRVLKTMGHSDETLKRQPPELAECYYYFRQLPHYFISFTSLMQNVAPNINAAQLGRVTQPVLFLLGTNDTFASIKTGESIANAIPDCEFYPIPGAGHLPWLEDPAGCAVYINGFLERHNDL